MPLQTPPKFCIIPWVSAHVSSSGHRKLCCSAEAFQDHDVSNIEFFEDYWNSKKLKDVRKQILSNQVPKECLTCVQSTTKRHEYNQSFQEKIEPALTQTSPDGFYPFSASFLDYRLSNVCNLSCRMCNSYSSSTIKKLESDAGILNIDLIDKKRQLFLFEEAKRLIKEKTIKQIYFADGEPFYSTFHWEIINLCIEENQAHEIILNYSSNLSTTSYRNKSIFTYLKQFKDVRLMASLDGVGDTLTFIRSGITFKNWQKSFDEWFIFSGPEKITFNIVLTTPTLLNLFELLDFVIATKCLYTFAQVTGDAHEVIFSPRSLDRGTLTKILSSQLEMIRAKFGHIEALETNIAYLFENKLMFEEENSSGKIQKIIDAFFYHDAIDLQRPDKSSTLEWFLSQPALKAWTQTFLSIPPVNLAGLIRGKFHHYKEQDFIVFKKRLDFYETLIFDFSFHSRKINVSFLEEIVSKLVPQGQRIIMIGPSHSLFNRFLNFKYKQRYFSKKELFSDKNNMMTLTNFLKTQSHLKVKRYPLPVTSKIIQTSFFKKAFICQLLDFLGRTFPAIFSMHYAWMIDTSEINK